MILKINFKEGARLGEKLRARRENLGISQRELALETKSPLKYIEALEENRLEDFPAKVYALGFFKKMLGALKIEDTADFLHEFEKEWEVKFFRKDGSLRKLPEQNAKKFLFTPRITAIGAGGVLIILFTGLLLSRFYDFTGSPVLSISEPKDGAIVSEMLVRVKGATEKESHLTVNGRELKIDKSGNFDQDLELLPGLNTLNFLTQNRFGKKTEKTLQVLINNHD